MNYYQIGLEVETAVERARYLDTGTRNFHTGSRRFYDQGLTVGRHSLMIGAASGTPLGTAADGIVAIVLDIVHILLMVGGAVFLFRAIFPGVF